MRWAHRAAIGLLLLAAAGFSACHRTDPEIARVLDRQFEAARQGNAQAFLETMSPAYQDESFPLAVGREKVIARLALPAPLAAEVLSRAVTQEGDRAVAQEEFSLEGLLADQPRRYREMENVRLEKTAAGWKIAAGSNLYALLAGRVEEEDRVAAVLDQRVQALEKGDLELYLSAVSPGYEMQGRTREDVRAKVQGIFESYRNIRYRVFDRRLRLEGDRAVVEQGFKLEAELEGVPQSFEDRERLELAREEGQWKIVRGL